MSYFEESVEVISLVSGADFSNEATIPGVNRFVTVGATGTVTLTPANGAATGVMTTNQPEGAAGRVAIAGVVPIVAGAAVVAGVAIGSLANGACGPAATTKLGIPLISGASGDIIPVKLTLPAAAAA